MTFLGFIGILLGFWTMAFLFYLVMVFVEEQRVYERARRERMAARDIKRRMFDARIEAEAIEACYRHLRDIKAE